MYLITGRDGINKHMIGKKLGVSMKKMKKRMDEMVIRYGIIETNEQAGKQVTLHNMEASIKKAELLKDFQHSNPSVHCCPDTNLYIQIPILHKLNVSTWWRRHGQYAKF